MRRSARAILPRLAPVLLLALGLAACRSFGTARWGDCPDADGAQASAASSAVFDWSEWPDMITSIDGNRCVGSGKTGYKRARLLPGRHVVEYRNYVLDLGYAAGRIELDVQAGHSYRFDFDACYWCRKRRFTAWVDDRTTGQVAWGQRPDWPSWYL